MRVATCGTLAESVASRKLDEAGIDVELTLTGNEGSWNRRWAWSRSTLLAATLYVAAVLAANATAEDFIELPFFGLVSIGTLFFGITFTQRDRVHRAGRPAVYTMIVVTACLAAVQSAFLGVSWRIIAASVLAILLAEAADTEVFHRLRGHSWYKRVAGSNAVSIPLDSVIFSVVAFAGVFSAYTIVEIVWGDIVAKGAVGALAALWRGRA